MSLVDLNRDRNSGYGIEFASRLEMFPLFFLVVDLSLPTNKVLSGPAGIWGFKCRPVG